MDIVTSFDKFGPTWLLVGILLAMVFYLFKKVLSVIENNTSTISKFSEIVSHCNKNKE
jgi:hypothetical protein